MFRPAVVLVIVVIDTEQQVGGDHLVTPPRTKSSVTFVSRIVNIKQIISRFRSFCKPVFSCRYFHCCFHVVIFIVPGDPQRNSVSCTFLSSAHAMPVHGRKFSFCPDNLRRILFSVIIFSGLDITPHGAKVAIKEALHYLDCLPL